MIHYLTPPPQSFLTSIVYPNFAKKTPENIPNIRGINEFQRGGGIFKKIYTHVINSSIHKGSGARSTAGVLLIPFTVIKTRVESGLFNYSGVLHALSKMFLYLISYPPPTSLHFLKTSIQELNIS